MAYLKKHGLKLAFFATKFRLPYKKEPIRAHIGLRWYTDCSCRFHPPKSHVDPVHAFL